MTATVGAGAVASSAVATLVLLALGLQGRDVPGRGGLAVLGGVVVASPLLLTLDVVTSAAVSALAVAAAAGLLAAYAERRRLEAATLLAPVAGGLALALGGVRFGALDGVVGAASVAAWGVAAAFAALWVGPGDGLPSRLFPLAGLSVVLAATGDADDVALLALGVVGATLAFLPGRRWGVRRDLGDGGRVFLGLLLAALAAEATTGAGVATALPVAALVAGIVLLDAATGLLLWGTAPPASHRRRHPHLAERLADHGVPYPVARRLLTGSQVVLGGIAVCVARGLAGPVTAAVAAGACVLAAVLLVVVPGHSGARNPVSTPRWLVATLVGFAAAVVVATAPAALALLSARDPIRLGVDQAKDALAAARDGRSADARSGFEEAARSFRRAHGDLDGPTQALGLAVPFLAPNLRAALTVADVGERLSEAGRSLAASADPRDLQVVDGRIPVEELRALEPDLGVVARELESAFDEIRRLDRAGLVPEVRDTIEEVDERLRRASVSASRAAEVLRLAPRMFGDGAPRRYLLVVQNNAESRGTGGLVTHYGELTAEDGRLRLGDLERVRTLIDRGTGRWRLHAPEDYVRRYAPFGVPDIFQNVNMSPDFPTVAGIVADLYAQASGRRVSGVVSVDPPALAQILRLTGPVRVEGWPEPITPANVVDVTLRDAYDVFEKTDRVEFLGDVADVVVDDLVTGAAGTPEELLDVLGAAVRGRHLALHLADDEEQALVADLGGAAGVPPVEGDLLHLVTQNAAQNKTDFYLGRTLRYAVDVEPDGDGGLARVRARLEVELRNDAPSSGRAAYAIGPVNDRFQPGENRLHLSLYTPLAVESAVLDGERIEVAPGVELDRPVYSALVRVPSRTTRTLVIDLAGVVRLDEGRYVLDVVRQPLLAADEVTVSVDAPAGWSVVAPEEGRAPVLRVDRDTRLTYELRRRSG